MNQEISALVMMDSTLSSHAEAIVRANLAVTTVKTFARYSIILVLLPPPDSTGLIATSIILKYCRMSVTQPVH
jgi:hypothetical protein